MKVPNTKVLCKKMHLMMMAANISMILVMAMLIRQKKLVWKMLELRYMEVVHVYEHDEFFTYVQCVLIDMFLDIWIEETKKEVRLEEKDGGAYENHLITRRW